MTTVLVHGTFDLLHLGHVRLFREASKLGRVVVTLTADTYMKKRKPVFNQQERAEMIEAVKYVDEVRIIDAITGVKAIEDVRPDIYVKGGDYAEIEKFPALVEEKNAIERLGGFLHIIPQEHQWHSSWLLSGKALR